VASRGYRVKYLLSVFEVNLEGSEVHADVEVAVEEACVFEVHWVRVDLVHVKK